MCTYVCVYVRICVILLSTSHVRVFVYPYILHTANSTSVWINIIHLFIFTLSKQTEKIAQRSKIMRHSTHKLNSTRTTHSVFSSKRFSFGSWIRAHSPFCVFGYDLCVTLRHYVYRMVRIKNEMKRKTAWKHRWKKIIKTKKKWSHPNDMNSIHKHRSRSFYRSLLQLFSSMYSQFFYSFFFNTFDCKTFHLNLSTHRVRMMRFDFRWHSHFIIIYSSISKL